jgi:hypothetical protein
MARNDAGQAVLDGTTSDTGSKASLDASTSASDASTTSDSSIATPDATATTRPCARNTPFTALPWAHPTPLHQGVCTVAQTAAYVDSFYAEAGTITSGSASCDACIQTDSSASALGPIILVPESGQEIPTWVNMGGCVANFDGEPDAGSCGNDLNDYNECIQDECGSCSDFDMPTPAGPTAVCESEVLGAGGACAAEAITRPLCIVELANDGGSEQQCTDITLQELLDLWCGS